MPNHYKSHHIRWFSTTNGRWTVRWWDRSWKRIRNSLQTQYSISLVEESTSRNRKGFKWYPVVSCGKPNAINHPSDMVWPRTIHHPSLQKVEYQPWRCFMAAESKYPFEFRSALGVSGRNEEGAIPRPSRGGRYHLVSHIAMVCIPYSHGGL